jgi:selenocysteine-specific elongation factor
VKRILFGVMGHVDHGKTALVRALTGIETDRLPEERRRGVSIVLGFAHARIGEVEADFIDMPGHERFVRTMVSGATGIQAALLVVAADEGVMPQTREHVDVAALLGVACAVVVVSKADLVDRETAEAAGAEAVALAKRAGLAPEGPVVVSAETGEGLDDLRAAIVREAERVQDGMEDAGYPYLPIDRAFVMGGHGTVVTGTLRRGRLVKGDVLSLAPADKPVRVRGLQVHGQPVDAALPGQRVAVNLRGVEVEDAGRGSALLAPDAIRPSSWLTVELRVPPGGAELRTGARLNLLIATAETPVRLRLLEADTIVPGAVMLAQLHASEPVAVPSRERFVLRAISPPLTVAGGRVLDPQAKRLRRKDTEMPGSLHRLVAAEGADILAVAIAQAGAKGVTTERLAVLSGLSTGRVQGLLTGLPVERAGELAITRDAFQSLQAEVSSRLQRTPEPTALARLAAGFPQASFEAVKAAVGRFAEAGRVRLEGGAVRWIRVEQERARAEDETALAARLAEALRRGGLSPPDLAASTANRELRRALDRLVHANLAVRTWDRVQKREIVFHREAVDQARRTLQPLLAGPGLSVSEVGKALGASRKFTVPLLEHLDAVQFTKRVGERRVLGPSASV